MTATLAARRTARATRRRRRGRARRRPRGRPSVAAIGNATSIVAALERARDAEARVLEDAQHRRVLGQHLGDEALDPDRGRARGELLEQPRADARGPAGRRRRRTRPRPSTGRAAARSSRARRCAPVAAASVPTSAPRSSQSGSRNGSTSGSADAWASRGSAGSGSARRARGRTRRAPRRRRAPGRPQPQRAAVAQDDVDESVFSDSGLPGACVVRSLVRQRFHSPGSRHPASQYAEGPRGRALWSRCAKRFN